MCIIDGQFMEVIGHCFLETWIRTIEFFVKKLKKNKFFDERNEKRIVAKKLSDVLNDEKRLNICYF